MLTTIIPDRAVQYHGGLEVTKKWFRFQQFVFLDDLVYHPNMEKTSEQ